MKINPAASDLNYSQRVDTKEDTSDQGFSEHLQQQDQKQKDKEKNERETIEVTDQNVQSAIDHFQKEIQADENGLEAVPEGHGPGLRVLLKDGKGAIIRQWTGEEFLKLRQAASEQGQEPARGKILDQKL